MIFPLSSPQALTRFYEMATYLVNYSEGRYSLNDVYEMIPWEYMIIVSMFEEKKQS